MSHTAGSLLGGRVRYHQQTRGHRSGIEPVLLAAAIPARAGERVLEAGTGAGAALLCLAHRLGDDLHGLGIERDPALAALAAQNLRANGFDRVHVIAADITSAPLAGPAGHASFDHAFANPPWRDPRDTPSPDPGRRLAYGSAAGLLEAWVAALAGVLRARGSLTLILPTASLDEALAALRRARCGSFRLLPLWPRAGKPPKLLIVQAIRGGRSPTVLLPGLTLHDEHGFTSAASQILRDGTALSL